MPVASHSSPTPVSVAAASSNLAYASWAVP
jgi:hypothetical protein